MAHGTILASDRAQVEGLSALLWLNVMALAVAFFCLDHSYDLSLQRDLIVEQPVEVAELVQTENPLRKIGYLLMGAAALQVWLTPAPKRRIGFSLGLWSLVGYLVWCASSVTWSQDPSTTTRRLVPLALIILCALGWSRHLNLGQLWVFGFLIPGIHLLVGIFAELQLHSFQPWQSDYRFMGTTHPNVQGLQCALLILSLFTAQSAGALSRRLVWPLAAVAFVALVLTKSRTALVALVGGCILTAIPLVHPGIQAGVGLVFPFLASVVLLIGNLFQGGIVDTLLRLALMGRTDETGTLTGRLPLWKELFWYFREQPLTGYGYGGFWTPQRTLKISESQDWVIAHAHNAFLEIALNTGIIGLALALTTALCAWLPATVRFLATHNSQYFFACGLAAIALIFSMTEGVFAQHGFAMFCLILTMCTLCLERCGAKV